MADEVNITFNATSVSELAARLETTGTKDLENALVLANRKLVLATRRSLGQLYGAGLAQRWVVKSNVDMRNPDKMATVEVTTNDPIVQYWEHGTRAHIIRARNAHALRFVVNGQTVFARSVHHPGAKAHNRLGDLQKNFDDRVIAVWQPAIEEAIDETFSQR